MAGIGKPRRRVVVQPIELPKEKEKPAPRPKRKEREKIPA